MVQERNATEARQGEGGARGMRNLWVLAISTGLAVAIAAGAYWWLLATPAEDARGDIPQAESPNTTGEGLPPLETPDGG